MREVRFESDEPPVTSANSPRSVESSWSILATQADGWRINDCKSMLNREGIETETKSSGNAQLRVGRSDYARGIRLLDARRRELKQKPSGGGAIVAMSFVAMLGVLLFGGVAAGSMLGLGQDVVFLMVLIVGVLAAFGILTAMTRR